MKVHHPLNLSIWIVWIFVLVGCSGTQKWAEPPPWVNQRPTVPAHYIGISSANKAQYGSDASATARKRALAELSGQIRVVIESTSILHTTQFQGIAGQNFSERIQSASTEDLEGYELVGEYENDSEIWAYYRLNMATYERIRNERKLATLNIAGGYWRSGLDARAGGRVAAALDFYIRALETMEPYWGEFNEWTTSEGTVSLDRACLEGITRILASLKLSLNAEEVTLTFADRYAGRVGCTVKLDGQPVGQIPVWSRYNRGTLPKTSTQTTNAQGACSFELGQFEPRTQSSELRLEIRMEDLVPRLQESPVAKLIQTLPTPTASIPILLESPTVYLACIERTNGKLNGKTVLNNAIAQGLNDRGIQWVKKEAEADLILELTADTREAGSAAGFFTVLLNASAVLHTPDGRPVLQQNLTDIKGVQLNWEAAHDAAYRNAQMEIQGTFLKKMIQALYQ